MTKGRVYYEIMSNDGCPLGLECKTLKEAKQAIRDIIKTDKAEFGWEKDECVHYWIMKYIETKDKVYYEEIGSNWSF